MHKGELRVLVKASDAFNCDNLLIITMHEDKEEIVNKKKIKFLPVWKWLLDGNITPT
ncbi:hypothetical protein HYW75_03135 [Candidatus Pacearchaeota archaeon]|nr:hypothetical protein [Candidatus Pacearchaeota archaeon]